jgi:hypothetical protein
MDTASRANTKGSITVIPTGGAWTPALLATLNKINNFQAREIPHPEFAASMNAALIARHEERILNSECSDGMPYCGPKYPFL